MQSMIENNKRLIDELLIILLFFVEKFSVILNKNRKLGESFLC